MCDHADKRIVVIATKADSKTTLNDMKRVVDAFKTLARDVATAMTFDPVKVDGLLCYDVRRPLT